MKPTTHRIILTGLITVFLLLIFVSCNQKRPGKGEPAPERLTYLIMISNLQEELQCEVLINSIRQFGGGLSKGRVIVIRSDTMDLLGSHIQTQADTILDLKMDENLRSFPFSDKVFACAQVESMVEDSTEWLVWLNSDAIVFNPPLDLLSGDKWVSVRPVHHRNVGSLFEEGINPYWRNIYLKTEVDTSSLWPVESYVDSQKIRPYYNSGCMAFRPEKGILRAWKDAYCSMLGDSDLYHFYAADTNGAIFFHQAILSSVIISSAGKERINILPPSYSYPLVLQKMGFSGKIDSIPCMSIVLCGNYENLNMLKKSEPYTSWLRLSIGL